uniref:Uncharacterized protein n=1 Tax=Alexandrium catenella TaxID=2925 RepID=A0A7S1MIT3_ALECA
MQNAGESFESNFGLAAGGLGGLTAPSERSGAAAAPQEGFAAEVRERFRFLNAEDQKTVCRLECQLATKREEALYKLADQTIEQYRRALEVNGAVVASGQVGEEGEAMGLPPELVKRIEARMKLLRDTVMAVAAEPTVSLPQLTPLEQAQGFAFTSYAKTARVMSKAAEAFKGETQDSGGLTGQQLLGGARAAFGSLASRFRGRAGSGGAESPGGSFQSQ